MKVNKKIFSFLLMLALLLPAGMPVFADDANGDGYNDHDFNAIQDFLNSSSATGGVTNGQTLQNWQESPGVYDPANPATWRNVEWNDDEEKRVEEINWYNPGGQQLAGNLDLSDFEALESLQCINNALTSLNVSGCAALTELDCSHNQLSSLEVSDLTALEELGCSYNSLEELDVSDLTALEILSCSNNSLEELDISALADLETLRCRNNQLTTLDVSNCPLLSGLYCDGNPIEELDLWERRLDELTIGEDPAVIEITRNGFGSVGFEYSATTASHAVAVATSPGVFYNWTDNNDGSAEVSTSETIDFEPGESYSYTANFAYYNNHDFGALRDFFHERSARGTEENQEILGYHYTRPETWTGVTWNTDLEMRVTGIDLAGAGDLAGSLDLSDFEALESLDIGGNQITALNVSGCALLETLDCNSNQLSSLDLLDCTTLQYLYCGNNLLKQLETGGCPLERIDTRGNPLSHISTEINGSDVITLSAIGYGSVGLEYGEGDNQAIASPAAAGAFINWTDAEGAEVSAAAAVELDEGEDHELIANFRYGAIFDKNYNGAGGNEVILADFGETVAEPSEPPVRAGYTFGGWYKEAGCVNAWNFDSDTVTANTTLYAKWTANSSGGDGDGSGSSRGGSAPPPPPVSYNANVSGGGTVPVTVNTGAGSASLDLGTLAGNISGGGSTVVNIPSILGVNSYTANLPASSLSGSGQGSLTLNTGVGNLTIPGNMLSGTELSGNAGITVGEGDLSGLADDVKAAIGDRPIVQLTLTIDGRHTDWSNPDAPVTVSIPYVPSAEELANPEGIVIWYIDGKGNAVCVENGRYDPATGAVIVDVTHFSDYAVAYNPVSFNDAPAGAWYSKAVSFIAAREITTGTDGGNFSPDMKLTRGQFLVMLMKAYELAPDTDLTNNFSDAGNTYYTGYLAAAKRLGISGGVGDNLFAPEKEITRQEMFTMLYNALKEIGELPAGGTGKPLSSFSDAGQIASWAADAMTALVETGAIAGSGGKLDPAGTTSRAEMSQVLYNLLSK